MLALLSGARRFSSRRKNDPYLACSGAHALVVLTEWDQFTRLDFQRIFENMQRPCAAAKMGCRHVATCSRAYATTARHHHDFVFRGICVEPLICPRVFNVRRATR